MLNLLQKTSPVLLVFVAIGLHTFDCHAQSKVQVDEEVRVLFLGDWHDGIVLDRKGREATVQFTWANSDTTRTFDRNEIRRMNEVDALDFSRTWRSKTGGHRIEAAMKSFDGEKVEMIKEDMSIIKVELAKLSPSDNSYVEKFEKARKKMVASGTTPMITPDLPPVEDFGHGTFGSFTSMHFGETPEPLGPIPSFLKFNEQGFGFRMIRAKQELVAIIPVGGPQELVMLTTRDSNWATGGQMFQSQVYWISLKEQKLVSTVAITPEHYPLDYNPVSKLLLTKYIKGHFDEEPSTYTIWKLEPGKEKAQPITRWSVEDGTFLRAKFAKVVNDHVVIAKTAKHTYEAWDFIDKKSLYTLKSESFFDVPAILSPDRKTLIMPEDRQISLIDATDGKSIARLTQKSGSLTGANIDSTGTRLVASTSRDIQVWDLEKRETKPKVYAAPHVGSAFASRVEWVDDDHVLVEGSSARVLYRLSLELPVWSYTMDVGDHFSNKDPLKNLVVNSMFFYFAQPDWLNKEKIAVGVVSLPGPGVAEITADIERDTLDLLKPGIRIAIDAGGTRDKNQVYDWLAQKAEENEWIVDNNAPFVMTASMGRGERQSVVYEEIGGSGRQTVSFQPYFSTLKIMQDDFVVWQTGTSSGAPPMLTGRNAQKEVNRMQNPYIEFFKNVSIPGRVIDPKYSRGFGVSKLGLQGIEVVATSPPGREADPDEAARLAEEEQRKAEEERNSGGGENGQ